MRDRWAESDRHSGGGQSDEWWRTDGDGQKIGQRC